MQPTGHFGRALLKDFGVRSVRELSSRQRKHFEFAASTNSRARKLLHLIDVYFAPSWRDVRLLDIGCAHAGCVRETLERGGQAVGVERSKRLSKLAQANLYPQSAGERIIRGDATDPSLLSRLEPGSFNIIIVNDVFEHVFDTSRLLHVISKLASKAAVLYFAIPNGDYLPYVLDEPHQGGLGLTLLEPFSWRDIPGSGTRIYYRSWHHYAALFNRFGFRHPTLLSMVEHGPVIGKDIRGRVAGLLGEIETKLETSFTDSSIGLSKVRERVEAFASNLRCELRALSDDELAFRYLCPFWRGFAEFEPEGNGSSQWPEVLGLRPSYESVLSKMSEIDFWGFSPDHTGRSDWSVLAVSGRARCLFEVESDHSVRVSVRDSAAKPHYLYSGRSPFRHPPSGNRIVREPFFDLLSVEVTLETLSGKTSVQLWVIEYSQKMRLESHTLKLENGRNRLLLRPTPRARQFRVAFRLSEDGEVRLCKVVLRAGFIND